MKKSNDPKVSVYLLFAELLHKELDPQLLEMLRQPDVLDVFSQLDTECESYLTKAWDEADYEAAAVDFCDLFILPENSTAPRAAAWLEPGGKISPEAVAVVVRSFIEQWAIQVPTSYQYLAHDHASLIFYVAAVIRQADHEQANEFEKAVLKSWIGRFGAALSEAKSPIYRSLGMLLSDEDALA